MPNYTVHQTPSRPSGSRPGNRPPAITAAENVKQASEMLETQGQQLGSQVTDFLGKIRAA